MTSWIIFRKYVRPKNIRRKKGIMNCQSALHRVIVFVDVSKAEMDTKLHQLETSDVRSIKR